LNEPEAFICKALKGEAIVHYREPLIIRALPVRPGSLRLARRVKINEIKLTIILFTLWVFGTTALLPSKCCNLMVLQLLINFHARFKVITIKEGNGEGNTNSIEDNVRWSQNVSPRG
jgi:hypothetical protein